MTDAPSIKTGTAPPYEDIGTAALMYFDSAPTFETLAGAIKTELVSRILIPITDGGVDVKFVSTERLRCSPAAAGYLRHALNSALKPLEQDQGGIAANGTNHSIRSPGYHHVPRRRDRCEKLQGAPRMGDIGETAQFVQWPSPHQRGILSVASISTDRRPRAHRHCIPVTLPHRPQSERVRPGNRDATEC